MTRLAARAADSAVPIAKPFSTERRLAIRPLVDLAQHDRLPERLRQRRDETANRVGIPLVQDFGFWRGWRLLPQGNGVRILRRVAVHGERRTRTAREFAANDITQDGE